MSLSFYFSFSLAQGHHAPAFLSLSSGCVYGGAADKADPQLFLSILLFRLWPVQRAGWGIWGLLKGGNGDGGVLLTDNTLFDSTQRGELLDLFFVLLDISEQTYCTELTEIVDMYEARST